MSVIIINSYSYGGAALSPRRYWRVTFTDTLGSNQDFWLTRLAGYEDLDRGLNNLAGASLSTNLTWNGLDRGQIESLQEWPTRDYFGFFDTTLNVPNNVQMTYDLGAGNEAAINHIDIIAGLVGGETPQDFTVSFSDDGTNFFDAWSSGTVAVYAAQEERSFSIDPLPSESSEGVLTPRNRSFVVAGVAAAGQTVQRSRSFIVAGKRDDGLAVTEATTYVVVTP